MKGTVALWVPFATGIVVRAERIRTYMYNRCLSRASLFSRRERVCDWSVALGLAQAPPGSRGPVSFRFLARRRLRFLGDKHPVHSRLPKIILVARSWGRLKNA